MSSGITVSQEAIDKFQDIKNGKKTRFCMFHLNENQTTIIPGKSISKPEKLDLGIEAVKTEWAEFCDSLSDNECFYIIYDLNYQKDVGARRDKILFVCWCPEKAPIRCKMMFSSTRSAIKKAFNGIQVEIQACDLDDLSFDEVQQRVDKA
ncbi:cofilin-like [Argonauta hians]